LIPNVLCDLKSIFTASFPASKVMDLEKFVAAKVNILSFKQGKLYIRKALKLGRYSGLNELYHRDAHHSRSSL
jgi:hypothetical protein